MTSELVVDVQPKEVSIALLEDKQLVELQSEGRNISFSVGNMYLGRVKKIDARPECLLRGRGLRERRFSSLSGPGSSI